MPAKFGEISSMFKPLLMRFIRLNNQTKSNKAVALSELGPLLKMLSMYIIYTFHCRGLYRNVIKLSKEKCRAQTSRKTLCT